MNNNFNAKDIIEIINEITTTEDKMSELLKNIASSFSSLSGIVASEDSGLSGTCNNINDTYKKLAAKLSLNFGIIKTSLTKYMEETLQNEGTSTESLTKTVEGLENVRSELNNI